MEENSPIHLSFSLVLSECATSFRVAICSSRQPIPYQFPLPRPYGGREAGRLLGRGETLPVRPTYPAGTNYCGVGASRSSPPLWLAYTQARPTTTEKWKVAAED